MSTILAAIADSSGPLCAHNQVMTTTGRALRLLSLLQSRPTWTGTELGARLGVTPRSIRRDVERLRELGYPVRASRGVGGGYQLGAGRALPPLLLDDEEAVAVAVCLRLAAGGTVEGLGEAALRTLAKLDQVLPARLRSKVAAVHEATTTLEGEGPRVDPDTLVILARGCRECARVGFSYAARSGAVSERRVEPYRLVATGRRWYLVAYDLDREDWRSFRLDRMSSVAATGWRFRARPAPDPARFVQQGTSVEPYPHVARVRLHASKDAAAEYLPPTVGTLETVDEATCLFVAGGHDLESMAWHLARLPWRFQVLGPPELMAVMRSLAVRLSDAASESPGAQRRTPSSSSSRSRG